MLKSADIGNVDKKFENFGYSLIKNKIGSKNRIVSNTQAEEERKEVDEDSKMITKAEMDNEECSCVFPEDDCSVCGD